MITTCKQSQAQFYGEFLMGRGKFEPAEFGVNLSREVFTDEIVNEFGDTYRGAWTIDELLLHPRGAMRFCDEIRRKRGWYDVPDDIMLRVVMTRRKSP
jgi:hypothetical protein